MMRITIIILILILSVQIKGSRNFVEWLKTVPTSQFGSGLKALIPNINPSMDQASGDTYAE